MADNQETAPEQQENQSSKIQKRFDTIRAKIQGVFAGADPTVAFDLPKRPPKVPAGVAHAAAQTALTKRQEAQRTKLEEDLMKLMDDYVAFEVSMDEADKAAKKSREDKMKELCDKVDKVFKEIDGVDAIGQRYTNLFLRPQPAAANPEAGGL